ncbi:methyltransferase domain-containing protein [Kitasatospora purpeofusca]|uniref:class I SAM-dependent methyltransferase n=1 Tax=Kitasatospora purpeofusca TaxID=67352 RepID=UPI002259C0A6|nr:class I SAM-dependent methyltransferase [Kitasatospora purpeofusca]MCX4690106.1 methyltransferase domain-containing protein [Kitasatospora purpeofusca]
MTDTSPADTWQLSDTEVFSKYGDAFVPRRAEQTAAVCDLLAGVPVPHVLDLCCGEGRLSEEYLRRDPEARVTVLDRSPEMLALTAKRLEPFADRHDSIEADIEDGLWRTGVGYGGVMTSLAVHHLDGEGKRLLYRDIHAMLAPGGVFVMADLVEPAGATARTLAGDHWEEAVRRASEEQFGGDEAAVAFERTEWNHYRLPGPDPVDKPSSVAEHLDWLREAGFVEVDVVWMYAGHALFTAKRKAN